MKIIKVGSTKLRGHPIPKNKSKRAKRREFRLEKAVEKESKKQRDNQQNQLKAKAGKKLVINEERTSLRKRIEELEAQLDYKLSLDKS